MRSLDNVVRDEHVSRGQEAALADVGVSVRHILGYLCGSSPEEAVESFSRRVTTGSRKLSLDDVRSAAAYAARLVDDEELSSSETARFFDLHGIKGVVDFEHVRQAAPLILGFMA